ncbi:MAG: OmpH family outer membrane protein, partial [Candidatus Omnitrophota bacterium]|nr:OmpH family outer membrane protein [Candidatus Omnitrophota bacterium]
GSGSKRPVLFQHNQRFLNKEDKVKKLSVIFLGLTMLVALIAPVSSEGKDISKVGYIDLAKIFDQYNKTKDSDSKLEDEWKDKQDEVKKLKDKITGLKDELDLLSPEGKDKKQIEIDKKIKKLQDFSKEAKDELGSKRSEMVREILGDIDKVINEYGKSQGYDLILNERVLLYRKEGLDLTDKVVKILNNKYKK